MAPSFLFGLAAMLVLLLPAAVAAWEHRILPDAYYAAIAIPGAIFAFAIDGWIGIALAAAGAVLCLAILGLVITIQRRFWGRRLLSGGHIKLTGAGAVWCGLPGALAMLALGLAMHFASALFLRVRKSAHPRPHFALSAIGAMLAVMILRGLWAPT